MKKILISTVLLTAFLTVSCDQSLLDIPQKGVISIDDFYQTEEDAEAATVAIYNTASSQLIVGTGAGTGIYMPYILMTNLPSDDLYAAGNYRGDNDFAAQINEFRFSTDNEVMTRAYRGLYSLIYSANLVISKFEYGTSDKIDRNISEARTWRAWAHMVLAIFWNNPPKIDYVLAGTEYPENTPHDELLEWVITELGQAAPYLPARAGTGDKNGAVRLTRGAAYSFMGKAQVFAGKYADAAQNLKNNVINSGNYALVPGAQMFDLFHMAGNGNSEKIFEFNNVENTALGFWTQNGLTSWMHNNMWHWRIDKFTVAPSNVHDNGWGGCNPTGEFAEALITNDGIDSYRRKAWILTYDEVLYDLPYPSDAKMTTLAQKQSDPERGIDPNQPGLYAHEGYFMWKRTPITADEYVNRDVFGNNLVIMRYAEVLLLYAEACAQSGTDLAGGLAALNEVQQRAGSAHISTALTLDEVKQEKRFECWMEGTRYPDLVRWGDAATALANNGKAMPYFKDLIGTSAAYTIHTGYVDWTDSDYNGTKYGFQAGKNEYYPFPYAETSTNPNIVQNPGW